MTSAQINGKVEERLSLVGLVCVAWGSSKLQQHWSSRKRRVPKSWLHAKYDCAHRKWLRQSTAENWSLLRANMSSVRSCPIDRSKKRARGRWDEMRRYGKEPSKMKEALVWVGNQLLCRRSAGQEWTSVSVCTFARSVCVFLALWLVAPHANNSICQHLFVVVVYKAVMNESLPLCLCTDQLLDNGSIYISSSSSSRQFAQ